MSQQRQKAVLVLHRLVYRPVRVDTHRKLLLERSDIARRDVVRLNDPDFFLCEVVERARDKPRGDDLVAVQDHEVVILRRAQEVVEIPCLEAYAVCATNHLDPMDQGECVDFADVRFLTAVIQDDSAKVLVILFHRTCE